MTIKDFFPRVFSYIYRNTVRRILPVSGYAEYNGVKVESLKILDKYFSYFHKDMKNIPHYENAIVQAIQKYVKFGDIVTIIGGGYGVTVVKALQKIGSKGKLYCYEGSQEYIKYVKQTISYNSHSVPDRNIVVSNHFVGSDEYVYGSCGSALPIERLPFCDVLELDCEGSERLILPFLSFRPRVIIVETHGVYGAATEDIKEMLKKRDYTIMSVEIAEKDYSEICLKNDIMVIAAIDSHHTYVNSIRVVEDKLSKKTENN